MRAPAAGFTLIEVMVAVAVLTTGLVGVMIAANRVLQGSVLVVNQMEATVLAQQRLAELELAMLTTGQPPSEKAGTAGRFRWVMETSPDAAHPDTPFQQWTATVAWAARPAERSVTLRRLAWVRAS